MTFVDFPGTHLDVIHTYGTNPALFEVGRLVGIERNASTISYAYDRFGRLTQDGALTYAYDRNGNRTVKPMSRPSLGWIILSVALTSQAACADVSHGAINLKLDVTIRCPVGGTEGLTIAVRDERVTSRDFVVCVMRTGERCQGEVAYRFSQRSWPLVTSAQRMLNRKEEAQPLHIVVTREGGKEMAHESLGRLTPAELQGYATVGRVIRIASGC